MANPFAFDFRTIPPPRFDPGRTTEDSPELTDQAEPNEQTEDAKADAATGKAGQTFLVGVQRRRMASLKRAAELLTVLPAEGESLHGILYGYFDLMNMVLAFLDRAGSSCLKLRIATLSLSKRNVQELAALLDAGTVKTLDVLTSDFQKEHDTEILAEALAELSVKRGQRIAAARSHCKIVTLALADGRRYVLEGSANLRTSRNQEQFCLSRDAGLHDFYDTWLRDTVATHEIRSSDGPATG